MTQYQFAKYAGVNPGIVKRAILGGIVSADSYKWIMEALEEKGVKV